MALILQGKVIKEHTVHIDEQYKGSIIALIIVFEHSS